MKKYIVITIYVIAVLICINAKTIMHISVQVITELPCIKARIASGEKTPFILKLKELKSSTEESPKHEVIEDELWRGRYDFSCEPVEIIAQATNE